MSLDKFALVSEVWDRLVQSNLASYKRPPLPINSWQKTCVGTNKNKASLCLSAHLKAALYDTKVIQSDIAAFDAKMRPEVIHYYDDKCES